jgi:hypothetical protein
MKQQIRRSAPHERTTATLWLGPAAAAACTGFAFLLYWWTAAPGITWEHEAADGAELLAAAMTGGVPHPPGYPLYIMLLQAWLTIGAWFAPGVELARMGNLLSATCAALGAGVTVVVTGALLPAAKARWVWAVLAATAWVISPLLWGQAVVTEVYALHTLLVALLGWVVLVRRGQWQLLTPVVACGVAHHLTFVLLLPAVVYYLWQLDGGHWRALIRVVAVVGGGVVLGLLLYIRIPLAAAGNGTPPPVNWGYADNWEGFWWLVSGVAYRGYLFAGSSGDLFGRLTQWAYTLTLQYTPVGLALGLWGLAAWDRDRPVLRNFSLLWVAPVSAYAIGYYTRDSEIYLLPVTWLVAVWLGVGLAEAATQLQHRWPRWPAVQVLGGVAAIGLAVLLAVRLPVLSLRHEQRAQEFVTGVATTIPPDAVVVSLADAETFALWYGAWASGELTGAAPDLVLVNYSLYQFDWYRRLLRMTYPHVVGDETTIDHFLATQRQQRPIYFSEQLSYVPSDHLIPAGPIWRYSPPP